LTIAANIGVLEPREISTSEGPAAGPMRAA